MHSWLLVGGVAVLVGGLAFGEIRRFERDAAAEIATTLQGDAKAVQIQTAFEEPFGIFSGTLRKATITASNFSVDGLPLFVEPERSKRGKLKLLQLRLNEFTLKKLRVQELRADITNCRYDFSLALKQRKVRLSSAGSGPGYAKLRAGDLANFIMAKYPELTNVTVKLEKYKAFVEGDGDFSIFKAHFYVIAELSPTTN